MPQRRQPDSSPDQRHVRKLVHACNMPKRKKRVRAKPGKSKPRRPTKRHVAMDAIAQAVEHQDAIFREDKQEAISSLPEQCRVDRITDPVSSVALLVTGEWRWRRRSAVAAGYGYRFRVVSGSGTALFNFFEGAYLDSPAVATGSCRGHGPLGRDARTWAARSGRWCCLGLIRIS